MQRNAKAARPSALLFLPLNEHPGSAFGENPRYPSTLLPPLGEAQAGRSADFRWGFLEIPSLGVQERLETWCWVKKEICSLGFTFPVRTPGMPALPLAVAAVLNARRLKSSHKESLYSFTFLGKKRDFW